MQKRGFEDATSTQELLLKGERDAALLLQLAEFEYVPVLVTFDNKLCSQHPELIHNKRITVAVISSHNMPKDITLPQYLHEVVHRHVHRFAAQESGTAWRYTAGARRTRIKLM